MKTYTSIHPLTLESLKAQTGWEEGPDSDSIVDGHGNIAFVIELDDGRLQLDVDDDSDVSEVIELIAFHREDED